MRVIMRVAACMVSAAGVLARQVAPAARAVLGMATLPECRDGTIRVVTVLSGASGCQDGPYRLDLG
jgi:hypothetical protein